MTWELTPLKKITTKIGSGATPKGGKNSYKTEGITLIRSLNVYDFEFSYEGLAFITEGQASETRLARVIVEPKDILLNITGASVARCCMVPEHLLPARVNQHVSLVRIDSNRADSHYVLYCINSPVYKHQLLNLAQGGTTREALTKEIIGNFEISLPSLITQRKIAAVLSAYDDLIGNNTRRIKILEEMARAIYREWFVEFRFPGHEGVEIVESDLGLIPQGWEVGKLGDTIENIKEKVKPGKHLEPLPYVPIDCIPRRSIGLVEHKPFSEAKSSLIAFRRNDILFGAMRSYFHKVTFAPFDGITRQTCFVLRSKNPDNYPFDLFTMFQDSTVEYSSNYSTGSTIPYATWDGVLARMSILRPPDLLIKRFSDIVAPMLDSIRVLTMKSTNLRQTRDLLLPKLISGEIDVSALDVGQDALLTR